MKTSKLLTIALLFVFYSCNNGVKTNAQKVDFGIYEIVTISNPDSIVAALKSGNIQIEKANEPSVIGYIKSSDSLIIQLGLSKDNFKLVKTIYKVGKEQKYAALVAIKSTPDINNAHIQKTGVEGNRVIIYFNWDGARKWAEMTKKNIGKQVAFVIDNQIYTMPLVNAVINGGVAQLDNLKNETIAKHISASLNSSLPK